VTGYPGQNAVWTPELSEALKACVLAGLSFAQSAAKLNSDFGTTFTRNAAIGRANRLGMQYPRQARATPKPPRYKKRNPSLRLVDGNGNSNHKRIIETSYSDQPELRCVEIIPLHLSLMDLERNGCRYPYGDGPFTFCGHPKQDSTSYCPAHFNLTRGRQVSPLSDGERQLRRQRYANTQRKRILQASA
jgi:GcrA cell cycle regulator